MLVATEDINKYKASKFYDITYPIPQELTKGKSTVTVKFKAKPNNMEGPAYGDVRMMRSAPSGIDYSSPNARPDDQVGRDSVWRGLLNISLVLKS